MRIPVRGCAFSMLGGTAHMLPNACAFSSLMASGVVLSIGYLIADAVIAAVLIFLQYFFTRRLNSAFTVGILISWAFTTVGGIFLLSDALAKAL